VKKYIALLACLIASSAIGQVVTYRLKGRILFPTNAPGFKTNGLYTFDFSIGSPIAVPAYGTYKSYGLLATSLKFNYENGTYVGTADAADLRASSYAHGDNFGIGTPFGGNVNFPDVAGQQLLRSGFSLLNAYDPTGAAFDSLAFIDPSTISQFLGRNATFSIIWGNHASGLPLSVIGGSVDVIENISPTLSPVPEPSTYGLMGSLALAGLIARKMRKRKQADC
jgi:PEP-CTERM motif